MDKKELLNNIAQREYEWLRTLNNESFKKEFSSWFMLDGTDTIYNLSESELTNLRPDLHDKYIEDFMRYKEAESEQILEKYYEHQAYFIKN